VLKLNKAQASPSEGTPLAFLHQVSASTCTTRLSVRIGRKAYAGDGRTIETLKGIQFDAGAREFISLLGPSGCGKTTLLRLIAGLDMCYEGRITMDGTLVKGPGLDRGVVFQESRLLPWLSVARNVEFALPNRVAKSDRLKRVDEILELVGLGNFRDSWPYQLSGGMEKRVGLARALVNLPKILLMDEPFSALDTTSKFSLQDEIAHIHEREKITTILVTHDVDEAVYLSDRIAVLSPSPATILAVYDIPLARPRTRTSEEVASFKRSIIDDLLKYNKGFGTAVVA
jgi:sulfonate transport system ATP-binding protein